MARTTKGRLYQRDGVWQVQYYVDGKQFRKSLKTRNKAKAEKEAERLLQPIKTSETAIELRAAAAAKEKVAALQAMEVRGKLTVTEAAAAFVASRERRPCVQRTLDDYLSLWAHFVRWADGKRTYMASVTRQDANDFAACLDKTNLSPNRRNKIIMTARLFFNVLRSECGDMENPFGANSKVGIKRLDDDARGRRALSEAELVEVCNRAEGELRTLLAVGLYTGLRLHDVACLRWESVDLRVGRINVRQHKVRKHKSVTVVLKLHDDLRRLFEETPKRARRGYVMPTTAAQYERNPSAITDALKAHFEACGITTTEDPKTKTSRRVRVLVGFHSLRHSFATIAAQKGVRKSCVQAAIGHSNPMMTDHYTDYCEIDTSDAVMAMPSISGKALPAGEAPIDHAARNAAAIAILEAAKSLTDREKAVLAALRGKEVLTPRKPRGEDASH